MLCLDGAFLTGTGPPVFRRIAPPTRRELQALVERIAQRIGRALERRGLIERDCENAYLSLDPSSDGPLDDLIGHSITYRIAVGPRAGQKVFTLQTLAAQSEEEEPRKRLVQASGFSLHAGIGIDAGQRKKLERLCRYISRPALAVERLSLTEQGLIRYRLKTPYRDGTTDVLFEPLDFLARLAALVPPPRIHLTRFHGVFAPASRLRADITPARRGRGGPTQSPDNAPPAPKHVSMTWMQRLKRVFAIDIDTCRRCGGPLKVLASIEDPELIANILSHLQQRSDEENNQHHRFPATARAPPQLAQLSLL